MAERLDDLEGLTSVTQMKPMFLGDNSRDGKMNATSPPLKGKNQK
jgi:hypothetical protein